MKESYTTRKVLGKYQKFTQKVLRKYQQSTKKELGKYPERSLKDWESTWTVLEKDCTSFGKEIGRYWIINKKILGNY